MSKEKDFFISEEYEILFTLAGLECFCHHVQEAGYYMHSLAVKNGGYDKALKLFSNDDNSVNLYWFSIIFEKIVLIEYMFKRWGLNVDHIKETSLAEAEKENAHLLTKEILDEKFTLPMERLLTLVFLAIEATHFLYLRVIKNGGYENVIKSDPDKENIFADEYYINELFKQITFFEFYLKNLNVDVETLKEVACNNFMNLITCTNNRKLVFEEILEMLKSDDNEKKGEKDE